MKARLLVPAVLLPLILANVLHAQNAPATERQRIALYGLMSYNTVSLPKWGAARDVKNPGESGDLLILKSLAEPGERITVGAYLSYRPVDANGQPVGDWRGVPTSSIGKEWGYESRSLQSVGVWTRMTNPRDARTEYTVPLFLPYGATDLPFGKYHFTYRVRVWIGDRLVDDFFVNEVRIGSITRSGFDREGRVICAAIQGPCLTQFRLLGTDDPADPIPEEAPAPVFDEAPPPRA